jgi:hypothetical protein
VISDYCSVYVQPLARVRATVTGSADQSEKPKDPKGRRGKATLSDLPSGTKMRFSVILIPNIKAYVGSIPAWVEPDLDIIKTMWAETNIGIVCGWEKDDPAHLLVCDMYMT